MSPFPLDRFDRRTQRDSRILRLHQLPLTEWAGDLPATGEGLRAAQAAIPLSIEEGAGPTPLLRQLAADIVRGEFDIDGARVTLAALLDPATLRRFRQLGVNTTDAETAVYVLRCIEVYVWRRSF